jgi:hypothetical protein
VVLKAEDAQIISTCLSPSTNSCYCTITRSNNVVVAVVVAAVAAVEELSYADKVLEALGHLPTLIRERKNEERREQPKKKKKSSV